jgi:DnaJ-class molecular chaperone
MFGSVHLHLGARHWACQIEGHQRGIAGKVRLKTRVANPTEQRCPACDGTGVLAAVQPVLPGRRLYPPPCKECGGRGRTPKADK